MSINEVDVLRAGLEMSEGAKAANVAYWMKSVSSHGFDYHQAEAISYLKKAAAHLGYTLTPIQEAPHVETDTTSKPDSGRLNLSDESPAPDLHHNYGA